MPTSALRTTALGIALALASALPAPWPGPGSLARGEEPEEDPAYDSPVAPTLHGKLGLTLADAIAMGLENNLDVQIQRYGPLIAYYDSRQAWGAYDPELFGDVGYSDNETPIASSLQTSASLDEKTTDGSGGFRGLVPYLGASYAITLSGQRLETNSSISSLSPEVRSGLSFNVTLPLLKDLIWNAPWTQLKTSRILYGEAGEEFRRSVMDTLQAIETAYWNLVAREEQWRVARKSLETRRALLSQVETQYEVGVVSKVDVVEAQAGVAEGEVNLILAENAYRTAQDILIDQVLGPHLTAGSRLEIEPTDRPEDYVQYEIDVEQAVAKALTRRPELASAKQEIERQQVLLRYAKNQRLPRLDLQAGYGFQGLAGKENPSRINFGAVSPTTQSIIDQVNDLNPSCDGTPSDPDCIVPPAPPAPLSIKNGYGSTFDDYFTQRGADQFSVRGVLSFPIPNTAARSAVSRSELELRRARTRYKRAEQNVILEVRKGARDLKSSQQGIEAAERRRLAAEEQLRAERVRLEHGESTPFDVLQRESALVEAESQKIGALQLYRNSVVALYRAQGTILEARNVVIDDVRPLR
jgi:outer membrane protein